MLRAEIDCSRSSMRHRELKPIVLEPYRNRLCQIEAQLQKESFKLRRCREGPGQSKVRIQALFFFYV
ncbi:rCG48743 [Rattus norvegicus]|uniref:RCG48743 n=1 Tax=Rattus norvegicus TaxID=10116 RepID=A6IGL9_RAT|nr:rCG48743 [Rattus norvegicus]